MNPHSQLTIRTATLSDIAQLVELRVLMQLEVNRLSADKIPANYRDLCTEYFKNSISSKKYYGSVAAVDGKIIAGAGVCFYEKPPGISGGVGIAGYVTNVYTLPEYRGKGISTKLMLVLTNFARDLGADKLHLGSTEDGLNVYKKVGFKDPKCIALEIRPPFQAI